LDFVGRRELTAQIGHEPQLWPLVVLKELLDNSLDATEEAEIAPEILLEVSTAPGAAMIRVSDNGPGLAAETVTDILDYSTRTSSREAYCSPTRGAQGNALKTIVAMPYALDGGVGTTLIESRALDHRITFSADAVRQIPRIAHETTPATRRNGTSITVFWPQSSLVFLSNSRGRFLQMAAGYAVLNPHLSLEVRWNGETVVNLPASDIGWLKWRACDPTSPHWYTSQRLARLAAAYVARDQDLGHPPRTVRAFVSEFHGLSSTGKQKTVVEAAGLARQPLAALFNDGAVNEARIWALLEAMQEHSRPVKPRDLGVIGGEHLREVCTHAGGLKETFRYRIVVGETSEEIPFVVEAAFAALSDDKARRLVLGINFAPALANPYRSIHTGYDGLETVLADQRCGRDEPIVLILHLACARLDYQDRGKSAVAQDSMIADAISTAINRCHWAMGEAAQSRGT
jgi:DNA topoisomerase VI subunit B